MESPNRYSIVVSGCAARMLVSHAAFLAQTSPAAARQLSAGFEKAVQSLEVMPQRCPWLKADYIPSNTYRYLIFEKRYLIIFQVRDNTVYVDYVVDCRQDYQWLIK